MGESERTWRERCKSLTRELTRNPFFPLLFISEAVKSGTFHVLTGEPGLDIVGAASGMALVSVVGWLYSIDDVKWGLHQAEEAVEDVTEE
jgi:hypothetical protein